MMKRAGRYLLWAAIVGGLHFALSLLAIYNGFIIFRSAETPWEVFWETAMEVFLFPADVLVRTVTDQWGQTLIIIANSLFWGCVIVGLIFAWRKRRASGKSIQAGGGSSDAGLHSSGQ
ncbi:MAG TPA: hypothetical protein VL221_04985 [Bacteroidota bacterium]|nr:hypothetical protein [Bacteroidota bacterium]